MKGLVQKGFSSKTCFELDAHDCFGYRLYDVSSNKLSSEKNMLTILYENRILSNLILYQNWDFAFYHVIATKPFKSSLLLHS